MADSALPTERNPFAAFVSQQTKTLIDRIKKADYTRSKEHIRKARVRIKRWRTLYQLIMVLVMHRVKSRPVERSIQRLFKRAGALRDCQLTRQLLAGLSLRNRLENRIQHFLKKQKKKARKRPKKAIRSAQFRHIRKLSRRIRQLAPAIAPRG